MKAFFACAVLALCVGVAVAAGEEAADHVLVLTSANFDEEVAKAKMTLVEFYAPWCGHCKQLAPEYSAAAAQLKADNFADGVLAKVDCTVERELCSKYEVRGFPTLKLFRSDNVDAPSDYDQARKSDALVKFMKKQNQPAVTTLASADAVAAFAKDDDVKVIAFLSEEAAAAFTKVASKMRNDFNFGLVTDAAVATAAGAKAGTVRVLRKFAADEPADTTAVSDEEELTKFIKANSFPLVGTIGPDNYAKYVERGFNFVWAFLDLDNTEQGKLVTDVLTPVAADFKDQLSFVKLDGIKWVEHGKSFGLSGKTPGIVIEDRTKSKNYVFDETATPTAASLRAFVKSYLSGELKPTVKSEPIPESNNEPVKVIVGHTFEQIVMDPTKDVLVEFYAPWCGHCKSLAPKYDELGKLFANDPTVVIAKVDATANDVPAEVQGFPTIMFYPAGAENKKAPVDFSGDRTVEAMAKFVQEHAKAPKTGSAAAAAGTAAGAKKEEL